MYLSILKLNVSPTKHPCSWIPKNVYVHSKYHTMRGITTEEDRQQKYLTFAKLLRRYY